MPPLHHTINSERMLQIVAIMLAHEYKGLERHKIEQALYDRVFRKAAGNLEALAFAGQMVQLMGNQRIY